MKFHIWSAFAILALSVACWGCAGGSDRVAKAQTQAFAVKHDSGYVKRVGLGVLHAPETQLGRESARRFAQSVASTIQAEVSRLKLLTAWENESIQTSINSLKGNDIDVAAAGWRAGGLQGMAVITLLDLRLVAEKTGALWFRKQRHFIKYNVVFDLYDTSTGAKLVSEVSEIKLKIGQDDYEALQSGSVLHISALDESLEDLADDIGELAAEALQDHPWRTSIISADEKHIVLAAGRASGLKVGDRFVIYRGNRHLAGPGGKFKLPGKKIVEVDINQVDEQRAYAAAQQTAVVQTDDIAIPLGR